uniref:Uncharacterized protein n=1 Tax=viral metagenome TaxID=1070528 RepID=A0A6M3X5A9_9ZZZZ
MGELNVLFPEKEVPLPDGSVLKVTPLSLKDLPKVVRAFGTIMKLATEQSGAFDKAKKSKKPVEGAYAEIAIAGAEELLQILPYCIDRKPEEVPLEVVPDVISIVIEQNVTDVAVKKWVALAQKVTGLLPKGVGQSVKSKL